MPKLVVIQGPAAGLEYPIRGDVILGRDPRCQVVIAHREVSGQHARITRVGERYFLEDLGSRNGTFLRDKAVLRQALHDGDEISIGRTTLRFELRQTQSLSSIRITDPGSLTVELDVTGDVFKFGKASTASGHRHIENILKLLLNVSRSIGSLSGLKTTLDEIAGTLLEVFPQCGRVMVLLSGDGVSLEPVVTRWRTDPELPSTQYSETIVRKALSEKRAILTIDALSDDRFASSRSVVDLRLRSLMCAPIVHREVVLGVVELDTLHSARMFTEEDLNLLTGVVAQLAFAVANAQLYDELRGMVGSTVSALTTMLGLKAPGILAHSERVSRYTLMMARRLELPPADVEALRLASLLHDIGLLALPDASLSSTEGGMPDFREARDLDPETLAGVHAHAEKAAEILSPIKPLSGVVQLILAHHERFDGLGYPRGLTGEEIPIGARVLAVADAFDVMMTGGSASMQERPLIALATLKEKAGRHFDPEIVALFNQLWEARLRLEARRGG